MWLSEVASRNIRGMLSSLNQFAVVIGILVTQGVGIAMDSSELYKYLLAITAVIAVVQLLGGALVLESPAWLLQHKGAEEAMGMLLAARGYSLAAAETELAEIRSATAAAASVKPPNVCELLTSKAYKVVRWPLVIACVLQLTQQLSGINAVFFYSTSFFKSAGVSNPQLGTVLVGAVNVVATGIAVYMMERVGRRKLLLSGTMGMLLSSLALVITLVFKNDHLGGVHVGSAADYLSIAFVLVFVSFFEVGLGAIPWQIGGEIFPEAPRATAMGLAAAVNWFGTFMVGLLFPYMNETIKQYAFLPFAVVLAVSFVFQYLYVPETRGQTLPQIQTLLRNSTPSCISGKRNLRHASNSSSFGDGVPGLLAENHGSTNYSQSDDASDARYGSRNSTDAGM
jgi:sugar porter (SP) family MFS transporter